MNNLWSIVQSKYDKKENRKYETLFTLANGYKGVRGALEFSKIGEKGNFIAGLFDKNTAQVTEIVNCQDPLVFNLYIDDEIVDLDKCKVIFYNRNLNMKEGILYTSFEVKTNKGKQIKVSSERFVSRNNVNRWAAKYIVTPVNFNGKLFVENIVDGSVTNSTYDPANTAKHFNVEKAIDLSPGVALLTKTIDENKMVIEGTTLVGVGENGNFLGSRKYYQFGEKVRELYQIFVSEKTEYVIYKFGATYTSRDTDVCVCTKLKEEINAFQHDGYDKEKEAHIAVWDKIWNQIDIVIEGDEKAQLGLRFNLFHLAASGYEGDEKVSLAAKALHGEGYKGHVFWDTEIFMLPFFIYTRPEVAKALLMYRYNTLEGARKNAALNGYKGAQFPWESAEEGTEVTPKWGLDYLGNPVRIWTGDEEYHINSDIAFGIWEYYRTTKDKEFLINYGLEMFLDTARFWQSRVEYNEDADRYEISRVIGPDEFHEHVDNNVYTNYLAKWNVKKALELAKWIKEEDSLVYSRLCTKLGLSDDDFTLWDEIQKKIFIPMSKDGKIIEQFEGYFNLEYLPITEHDENGMPVWPKGIKLDKLHDTQIIKQPDVVMLMLLLGEEFDEVTKRENYRYYEERTMHKSSLSPSMYSIMGLSIGDTQNAYKYFVKAIMTDIDDNQGNAELGLHAANTGGAWQSAVFGFGGLSVDNKEILNFNPWIPGNWKSLSFKINWRGSIVSVKVSEKNIEVHSDGNLELKVYDKNYEIKQNDKLVINR